MDLTLVRMITDLRARIEEKETDIAVAGNWGLPKRVLNKLEDGLTSLNQVLEMYEGDLVECMMGDEVTSFTHDGITYSYNEDYELLVGK